MAWSFNPFTGNLDLVGAGALVFEGEVETFADLPETVGDPAVGASFLVRSSTGVWLVNRRQAGIWIRRNNTGVRATDWEYGGDYPVNSVNGQTGNVVLGASDVGAAAATHASTHHTGGTDAIAPNQISAAWAQVLSNQTITANTLLSAGRNRRITLFAFGATANVDLPYQNNQAGDVVTLVSDFVVASTLTIRSASVMSGGTPLAYTTLATLNASGQSFTFVSNGTATGWSLRAVDTHTHTASQITDFAQAAQDYTVVSTAQTLTVGAKVAADTTAGAFTLTLPATPANGDTVSILDYAGTFDTNNLTIARNGSNIESLAEDMDCNIEDAAFSLVFVGSTVGWKVVPYFGNKTNFASPDPIGSVVPNSGAFTTLSANNGTQSIVAPALSAETTWNDEAVFVANTSGGTMTVTSMISGTIQVGQEITAGDLIGTVITGLGTGTGGTGTYTITSNSTRTGITFTTKQRLTAFSVNATDTSSGSYSRIADFQTDGISRFAVLKSGDINLRGTGTQRLFTSGAEYRFATHGGSDINSFTDVARFVNGNIFVPVGFGIGNNAVTGVDVLLTRDAAGTLAQRNFANPQTFNIYNTFTNSSNHERGFLRWSSNVLQIGTEAAGTGTVRNIEFVVPVRAASYRSTTTWIDFADASSGPRMGVYSHGGVLLRDSGYWGWHSAAGLTSGSTGDLRMYRSGAGILRLQSDTSDFNRIQFGGTTTSFPALKRDTTKLQARLADDSDFTAIQGKLTTETAYTAGAPTATGYLVLYDSNGTAYKVPAEAL